MRHIREITAVGPCYTAGRQTSKTMYFKKLMLVGAVSGAALAARAQIHLSVGIGVPVGPVVVVREAPPAPRYEDRSPPPGPDFFWVEGRWSRDRDQWIWIRGHWDHRPRPEAVWVAGHWDQRHDGWVWVDGRWDDRGPPREVIVQERPPEPFREEIPPPPGPDFFWVRGHWSWHDRWIWTHGHYDRRPRHDAEWSEGRYEHRPEGWIWVEGRWR